MAAVLLSTVGAFGYLRLAGGFSADVDLELRQRAQDLAGPLERAGVSLRDPSQPGSIERGESFAEVVTPTGRVLDSSPTLRGEGLLSPHEAATAARRTTTLDRSQAPGLDEPARLLATPLVRHGRRLVLVVGMTRENGLETLRRVRDELVVAIPLLVLLTFVGAYAVVGAALRPVELMRRRASEMTGGDPAARLPVPRTQDEISRLGETLNGLLARVEVTLERERAFSALASHELRTPLALLRTELELALRHPRDAAELRAAIRSGAAEVDRLERLADDLLLLAHAGENGLDVHAETVALADLVAGVAARFAPAFEVEGRRLEPGPCGAHVSADRRLVQQALTNLVANALEHGEGTVRVGARRHDHDVEVVVSDDGAGPEPELMARATQRFVRGPASTGAGLGLSIVTAIAEAHAGRCGIRHVEGGTEAWLTLPLVVPGPPSSGLAR